MRPTRNLFEYLTYVSLFSQLVAGPIVRFRQIESDLEHIDKQPRLDYMSRGVGFFVVGLLKKVVVADSIAASINPMIASVGSLSVLSAWLAALGFAFQIYYDFSGYSDMATYAVSDNLGTAMVVLLFMAILNAVFGSIGAGLVSRHGR